MIVVCNGMLRSGSTLQFNLARLIVDTANQGGALTEFIEKPSETDVAELAKKASLSNRILVLKTHHFPLLSLYEALDAKILYCHRDARDIAASIRKKWDEPFDEILGDIQYLMDVRDQLEQLPAGMMLSQPYLDLTAHTDQAAQDICAHLGLDLTPGQLAPIAAALSIDNVQKDLERRDTKEWRTVGGVDLVTFFHQDHISRDKGAAGSWRDVFSPHEISQLDSVIDAFAKDTPTAGDAR